MFDSLTRNGLWLGLFFLLVAGCTTPEPVQNSGVDLPAGWIVPAESRPTSVPLVTSTADAEIDQRWWTHFKDPVLDRLIGEALKNNPSLQIAAARVEEARAERRQTAAALYPQINGELSAQRGNQGYATQNQTINLTQVDLAASWELDLFGRNQARTAQATAILQSAEATQQAVRVALLADVARNYFEMRSFERQIAIANENLDTERRTLELIQAQLKGAIASDFDVQRAGAEVSATEALVPALQSAYDSAVNRLNVLVGVVPGSRDAWLQQPVEQTALDSGIVIAAPARVLETRPDVRAAERQFAASLSDSRAARADLFPDISLTALFGAQSATPFSSTPWGLGVNLVQPIVNFGRIQGEIEAADARQKASFANYQKIVLEATENMQDALSSYLHETARNASLATGVSQNRKADELARLQYTNGYVGLLDVLVVQRNLLDAQASQAVSDANLRIDLVGIYAAAGGGWKD
ncbi:MAG: efflux transporter outer membrane subunit [Burkholderiaceae bacterium]|jgi:multidrug efflux system outer membrane protein